MVWSLPRDDAKLTAVTLVPAVRISRSEPAPPSTEVSGAMNVTVSFPPPGIDDVGSAAAIDDIGARTAGNGVCADVPSTEIDWVTFRPTRRRSGSWSRWSGRPLD